MNRNLTRMVANILSIIAILAIAFPISGSVFAQDEPSPFSLHIRAYIDGYSQLVIQGNNIYWHHIGAAAPGRWLFVNEPTYLNGAEWYPTWPDELDAENRDCNCDSSTFSSLDPALPADQRFGFQIVQARNSVSISQQPTDENGYTLIIDFDDGPPGGAEWYEVVLVPASVTGEHWGTGGYGHPNGCNAFGWVQPFDGSDIETQVRILADGTEVASGETVGQGFYFNLWGLISNYQDHLINAQAYDAVYDRWVDLNYTPHTLQCLNYDIYILDTRDGTVRRLTTLEDTGEYNPSWSPDGKKIVHDVTNADFHALYITDVKTGVSTPLLGAEGGNDASWSPNGKWILFDRSPDGDSNLYLLPPTGGTPKPVVSDAVNGSWSPDGLRLVFQRGDGIWTASAKGDDVKQVVAQGYNPAWSPNGMWIAYELDGDIWKVRVNKNGAPIGDPIQVTSDPAREGGAAWSRDSKQIAFHSEASGDPAYYQDFDIWQISAEGGTPVRLARTSIFGDYDPAFNGMYIAYDGARMPSQPYIAAFPDWGYIEGHDWPQNDTVRLTIDDPATDVKPDYEAEQTTVPTTWGNWWVQFGFDYDLKVGDRVTQTDGYLTRSYTVRNLDVIDANRLTDTIYGLADPGEKVYLWVWGRDESYREVVTGADSTWLVDYSTVEFNLEPDMCGRAEVRDKIGNRTAMDWCVRVPRIVGSESGNWFWTTDFRQGPLDIFIYESADEGAPLLWSGQMEADHGGFVIVDPGIHGLDLLPGNTLVITDGVYTKELTLLPIGIYLFDTTNEVMAGTAPAGSEVWAKVGPQEWQEAIKVAADPVSGTWMADFKTIGFDITEEMRPWSYAHIYDADGDANEGSTPPALRVVASIPEDWFYVNNITPGATLSFAVYTSREGELVWSEEGIPPDEWGTAWIDAGGRWDLVPGSYLVVSDGNITKELEVEGFTFDTFDLATGQLTGTAPAPVGRAVWLGIGWQDEGAWMMVVPTDGTGAWLADFGKPVPSYYYWAAAQVFDGDGDASELRPPQQGPGTITVWYQWSGEYEANIADVFYTYMYEHPDLRINFTRVEDMKAALAEAIPAGEGPDIIADYNYEIGYFARDGYIAALGDYGLDQSALEATFEPAAAAGMIWQDDIWGLPASQENITIVYNKALASEADFPSDPLDFADLLVKAQAYYEANGKPLICNQGFSTTWDSYHVAPVFFGFDPLFPAYLDEDGNVFVDTPQKVAAGEWLLSIQPYLLPDASHMICRDALIAGQVAAWWTGPWAIADLEANGIDLGFVTMGKPFVGVRNLMLSTNAVARGNDGIALDVMKLFTGYEMQKYLALMNRSIPANTAALHDPEVQALPSIAGFSANANLGVPMANTPYAELQWGPVGDAVAAIWNGSLTPADALAAAQDAIEAAIAAMNP